jgi:hypothetical protein
VSGRLGGVAKLASPRIVSERAASFAFFGTRANGILRLRVTMKRAIGVFVALAVAADPARAESDDGSAIAEQLHTQARNLATANQWAEACAKFEESLRYASQLATRIELAGCYEHLGKLAAAWRLYRESSVAAAQAGDRDRRDAAQSRAAAIEPRLARLVIALPSHPPAGFAVTSDGAPLVLGAPGSASYLDAGSHAIAALAPGFAPTTRIVTLIAGKTETVTIPDLVVAAVPAPVAPMPSDPPPSSTRRYVGYAVAAAGVASAGVGLWFGHKASSTYDDAKALCGEKLSCSAANYDKGKQLIRDTRSNAAISTFLVAGGGAAIVVGAIVVLTAPRTAERSTAQLVPTASDRGAGLALVGSF